MMGRLKEEEEERQGGNPYAYKKLPWKILKIIFIRFNVYEFNARANS